MHLVEAARLWTMPLQLHPVPREDEDRELVAEIENHPDLTRDQKDALIREKRELREPRFRDRKMKQRIQGFSFAENLSWQRLVSLAPLREGFIAEERALLGGLIMFLVLLSVNVSLSRVARRHARRGKKRR